MINMQRKEWGLQFVLRLTIVGVISYGLYLNLYSAFNHQFQSWLLLFYTTISNILVLVLFLLLLLQSAQPAGRTASKRTPSTRLTQAKIALTWAISITGIVWHLLIVPELKNHDLGQFLQQGNLQAMMLSLSLLHTWSPLLTFLDWLFFDPKGSIKRISPLQWLLLPLGYFIFIVLWVNLIGPIAPEYNITYPYYFIDFQAHGILKTALFISVIAFFMLLLGYFYLLMDRVLHPVEKFFRPLNS